MTKEKVLVASRLLQRIENLEMQLDEVDNFNVNLAERVSSKDTPYPLNYEFSMEIYEREDIEDFKEIINKKIKETEARLEAL